MKVACENCGKVVEKIKNQVEKYDHQFCSRRCKSLFFSALRGMPKGKRRELSSTGDVIYKKKCRICQGSMQLTYATKGRVVCDSCKLSSSSRLKSSHEKQTTRCQDLTLEQYKAYHAAKIHHRIQLNVAIHNYARSWNKSLTKRPCQRCGYSCHIELAHIRAVSSFPLSSTLREVNSPDNLLVLCPNCHWEFDNGRLLLSDIPARLS